MKHTALQSKGSTAELLLKFQADGTGTVHISSDVGGRQQVTNRRGNRWGSTLIVTNAVELLLKL